MRAIRVATICFLLQGWLASGHAQTGAEARQVDLSSKADLAGDGRIYRVEWYHRATVDSASQAAYVLGVAVRSLTDNSPVLAEWEGTRPTTISTPDPALDELWPVPESGGRIITVRISYGAVAELTALRFEGRKLRVVGRWQDTGFSITRLGLEKQLVVIQTSAAAGNFPTLFAWDGNEFKEASHDFPDYYANWGANFVKEIRNSEPMPANVLTADCESVLKAFDYAGEPQLARQACAEARKRVSAGFAIVPRQQGESAQEFEEEKNSAVDAINHILTRGPRQQSARTFAPSSRNNARAHGSAFGTSGHAARPPLFRRRNPLQF